MTSEQENKERERLIAEAKEWLGTPYHTGGRVKGAGCDCGASGDTGADRSHQPALQRTGTPG